MQPIDTAWIAVLEDGQTFTDADGCEVRVLTAVEDELLGEPGPALCALADTDRYDMIVVGSGRLGLLRRVVLGSVSDHLVHHATCPVLVMRDDDSHT